MTASDQNMPIDLSVVEDEPDALSDIPSPERGRFSAASHDSSSLVASRAMQYKLFTSHFLSTWNSRVFEFGAVLYLASMFPGSLLPMSVYALVRGLSAIMLSAAIGRFIDSGNRLVVVRISIGMCQSILAWYLSDAKNTVLQRIAVALSCILFWVPFAAKVESLPFKLFVLSCVTALACAEKLGSVMNLVSIERDWVSAQYMRLETRLTGR